MPPMPDEGWDPVDGFGDYIVGIAGLDGRGGPLVGPSPAPIGPDPPGAGLRAGVDYPELGCESLVGAFVFLTGASFCSGSLSCLYSISALLVDSL
jgi:hypothetical protein